MANNNMLWLIGAVVVIYLVSTGGFGGTGTGTGSGTGTTQPPTTTACPTDGDSSLFLDVLNSANETASEGIDTTAYIYEVIGAQKTLVATLTDTTSPSATSINCGGNYEIGLVSSDGANGDNSRIKEIKSGVGGSIVNGNLMFMADSINEVFKVGIDQKATLNCRAKDNIGDGLMFDASDSVATDYEVDGVNFTSTTNNVTSLDETSGFDVNLECKAIQTDTNFNDRGIVVLVEMPTSEWNKPSAWINGQSLTEVKGSLNGNEQTAYTNYEAAFVIPETVLAKDGAEGFTLRVASNLKPGVAASTSNIEVDLAPRGQYLSIDGFTLKVGAVTDAASPAQVVTLYDSVFYLV